MLHFCNSLFKLNFNQCTINRINLHYSNLETNKTVFASYLDLKTNKIAKRNYSNKENKSDLKPVKNEIENEEINKSLLQKKEIAQIRYKKLEALKSNIFFYPHKFHVSLSIPDFKKKYSHLQPTELSNDSVSVAGRVISKRPMGKNLVFYDINSEFKNLQIMSHNKFYQKTEVFFQINETINHGDIIGIKGQPYKTKSEELSLKAHEIILLTPCLHLMPTTHYSLKNKETKYRQRYLDLITNELSKQKFFIRSKIIKYMRECFDNLGFLEIETPILSMVASGAKAKPFLTYHNEFHTNFYLRIAPELYHKTLLVGGINKVYEIGKSFRNEAVDKTHNPEFTMCELYMAFADYNDMMELVEKTISNLVIKLNGSYHLNYDPGDESNGSYIIDFTPPFRRISLVENLEKECGIKLPLPETFHTEESRQFFDNLCVRFEINCSTPRTTERLLDKLIQYFLENKCRNPTFILDYPQIMSPLAKHHRNKKGLAERFELFVNNQEICNAYTELNDPIIQRQKFQEQMKNKEKGDDEALDYDENYCVALEYGMPPCAGAGFGIDRLAMLLTNSTDIKDVLFFPVMRPTDNDK